MQIQQISGMNNNVGIQYGLKNKYSSQVVAPSFAGNEAVAPQENKNKKYLLAGLGILVAVIALIKHKEIGELFKKKPEIKPEAEVKPNVKRSYVGGGSYRRTSTPNPVPPKNLVPPTNPVQPKNTVPLTNEVPLKNPIIEPETIINKSADEAEVVHSAIKPTTEKPVQAKMDFTEEKIETVEIEKSRTPVEKVETTVEKEPVQAEIKPEVAAVETKNVETMITDSDIQKIMDRINGTPEEIAQRIKEGDKIAAARADENAQKLKSFPELIVHKDERWDIAQRNKIKRRNKQLDIDYYKDEFRAYTTISVDRLNNLRKSTNPELKAMFDLNRNNFTISSGIMIHGSDSLEKKGLLNHFVGEADKHGMKVIKLEAGDSDPHLFAQQIAKLFPEAKKRFQNEKIATMFVMEDMDKMLNLKDPKLSANGSMVRGMINVHTDKCGEDGVMWVSTIKDIKQIDPSCHDGGGGRVSYVIDIDNIARANK